MLNYKIFLSEKYILKSCLPRFSISGPVTLWSKWYSYTHTIDQFHKSHNAPVPYPTMQNSKQKCAHFSSEWCIVAHGTAA